MHLEQEEVKKCRSMNNVNDTIMGQLWGKNVKVCRGLQQFGNEKPVNVTVCRDFHRLSIPASGIELSSETLENTGKTRGLR